MSHLADASDLTAEHADDALHELYDGRDEWEPDDRVELKRELDREEEAVREQRRSEWWGR